MNTPKILSLATLVVALIFTNSFAATLTGKVVRVLDGDTIEVLINKEPLRIRLAEIDCPEKGQPFGNAAKQYVLDTAANQIVTVDDQSKDRYGRTIGEVFLPNGDSLNRLLVSHGYAWHYKQYSKNKSLGDLENDARVAKRGLWKDKEPVAPWQWRRDKRKKG